ncbi:hypothetical protein ABIC44_002759 [Sphingomonas sp. 1185]
MYFAFKPADSAAIHPGHPLSRNMGIDYGFH